jgi:serine protease Do
MTVIEDIAAALGDAVIGVASGGSGVVIAPGVAVTLARNVRGGAARVVTADGAAQDARVLGADPSVDLAVLALEDRGATAAWHDGAAPPGIGRKVYALADPGGTGLRVTGGAVAGVPRGVRGPSGRLVEGAIEHTAPLPRGSGGGPLVDRSGAVVGLNALRRDGGLILAWPATLLRERAAALAAGTSTAPRRLGVALLGPRQTRRMRAAVGLPDAGGLLVRGVQEGSPAEAAGLTRGDVVVAAGGTRVAGLDDLHAAIDAAGAGALALELLRGADRVTVEVPA